MIGEITELGRADEGEVSGVEEHNRPLALERLVRNFHKLTVVISGRLEGFNRGVNQRHDAHLSTFKRGEGTCVLASRRTMMMMGVVAKDLQLLFQIVCIDDLNRGVLCC
jgi:hypothetical protein